MVKWLSLFVFVPFAYEVKGGPDERLGQAPVAFVVNRAGEAAHPGGPG